MRRRRFLSLFGVGALGSLAGAGFAKSALPSTARSGREEILPSASGLQRIVWSVETDAPIAALTFDDGPDPAYTPRILEILDHYGVRATFLAMGYNAHKHPDLIREIVRGGHEIGSHGWEHLNLAEATAEEARKEITVGTRTIDRTAGVPVRLFRPPYGRFGEAAVRLLAQAGHDIVQWSVTRGELGWTDPERVAAHMAASLGPGEIIDLHDGLGRGTFNEGTDFVERLRRRRETEIEALPKTLRTLNARGLRLDTVSQVMASARPRRVQS